MFTLKYDSSDMWHYYLFDTYEDTDLTFEDVVLNHTIENDNFYFVNSEITDKEVIIRGYIRRNMFEITLKGVEISEDFTVTVEYATCKNKLINKFLQNHIIGTFKVAGDPELLSSGSAGVRRGRSVPALRSGGASGGPDPSRQSLEGALFRRESTRVAGHPGPGGLPAPHGEGAYVP